MIDTQKTFDSYTWNETSTADHVLIDVRTEAEYTTDHLPEAINIPLSGLETASPQMIKKLVGTNTPVLHCRGGRRATRAGEILKENGLEAKLLEGHYRGWKEAGSPTVGTGVISVERQVRIAAGIIVALGVLGGWLLNPWIAGISLFVGLGLTYAGISNTCGMALLIKKLPWN